MSDAFNSILPPDQPTATWLSRNRRIVILGAVALVLLVAAVLTAVLPRLQSKQTVNTVNVVINDSNVGSKDTDSTTNASTRNTFQRSTVSNVNTAPPPSYAPPTASQLQQAIQQLQAAKPTNK